MPQETGSPPRMRGKVFLLSFTMIRLRITPAYAERPTLVVLLLLQKDHPRVCGEKLFIAAVFSM